MQSSRPRTDLLKRVETAIDIAGQVSLLLRAVEHPRESREILRARFSTAAASLIRLRRQAHAVGKKNVNAMAMMRAIDTARADLEQAFLSAEACKLLGTKPKPLQPWPKRPLPGKGSVHTVSGGLPSLGKR